MRIFAIADSSKRKAKPWGLLRWMPDQENEQGIFELELVSDVSEDALPLSLAFCARREGRRATPRESEEWVRSRIVPEDRQNIAAVLSMNGLSRYSEIDLLAASKGASSDDDCLVYEIDVPSGVGCQLWGENADAGLTVDVLASHLERRREAGEVFYAFVDLDISDACSDGASSQGKDSASGVSSNDVFGMPGRSPAAKAIGSRIRAKRLEKGLTQKQLAARAGITQTVLSRVESGKGNPTLGLLEELACALDASLNVSLG